MKEDKSIGHSFLTKCLNFFTGGEFSKIDRASFCFFHGCIFIWTYCFLFATLFFLKNINKKRLSKYFIFRQPSKRIFRYILFYHEFFLYSYSISGCYFQQVNTLHKSGNIKLNTVSLTNAFQ